MDRKQKDTDDGVPHYTLKRTSSYLARITQSARWPWGGAYARVAPTSFPVGPDGRTIVLHRLTSYNKKALWDGVKAWFEGGSAVSGMINPAGAYVQTFRDKGGSTWEIYAENTPRDKKVAMAWSSFAMPIAPDPTTYGYQWNEQLVRKVNAPNGARVVLPEYFHLQNDGKKDR